MLSIGRLKTRGARGTVWRSVRLCYSRPHAHRPQCPDHAAGNRGQQPGPGRDCCRLRRAGGQRAVAWWLANSNDACLDRLRDRLTWQRTARAREAAAMTWDQVLVWLILPAIGTVIVGGGAVWL